MNPDQEREKNQQEFREILARYGLTQAQAAELITKETFRNVKARTVRTWLANSEAMSARSCPAWAVISLKRATVHLKPLTTKN